jgi:cytochrome c553
MSHHKRGRYFGPPIAGLMLAVLALFAGYPAAAEDKYAAVRDKLKGCFSCHGENGVSADPQIPILAGQHMYYTYVQLKDFQAGRRISPVMSEIMTGLDAEELRARGLKAGGSSAPVMSDVTDILTKAEMRAIATYFSEQEWPNSGYREDPAKARNGRTATVAGQCVQCHRGGYEGDSRIPHLAGQHAEYLRKTMMDFKSKARNNSAAKSSLMKSFSAEDIAAMAEFMAGM